MFNLNSEQNLRQIVEDFLYYEAALLDAWSLDEWLELLTDSCTYQIPSNDAPLANAKFSLFLIADNKKRIVERVHRLKDKNAHSEFPHSRTRRFISNVMILDQQEDHSGQTLINVQANFNIYRHRRDQDIRNYVGQYQYQLCLLNGKLQIARKIAILDAYELGSMGLVSFIL